MRTHLPAGILSTLCLAAAGLPVAAGAQTRPMLRVLMITGGLHHDYPTLSPLLASRLTARGDMRVELATDLARVHPATLAEQDVLLFNTCHQGAMPPQLREEIPRLVRSGKGLVAMHCALWSYQDWPQWAEMVGGFAPGHDKYRTYSVTVLDAGHAITAGLGHQFEITDEPYYVDKRDPDAQVLARTTDVLKDPIGQPREGREPQVWVKPYGKGRIASITFGHDDKSQSDERFITLLHNSIRWSARQVPDAPHNTLSKSEERAGFKLMFNGKDLTGWKADEKHWSVQDGELIGRTGKDDLKHNQFLIADGEHGDFFLKFSVKLRNHNSGVQFRSRAFPEFVVKGYQADIADGWYGSLYEEGGARGILANGWKGKGEKAAVLDGWNEMTLRAEGPKIKITLNGVTTVEYEEKQPDLQPARGVIALQIHSGPPMEVRFRDIRIQPLK
jgi:type 1 glutamine amidotransferase